MAGRGAPIGNRNGTRPFASALKHAIADAGQDRAALIEIAQALLAKALDGDLQAIREVADRLDGKPTQIVGGDADQPVHHLVSWSSTSNAES